MGNPGIAYKYVWACASNGAKALRGWKGRKEKVAGAVGAAATGPERLAECGIARLRCEMATDWGDNGASSVSYAQGSYDSCGGGLSPGGGVVRSIQSVAR